MPAPRAAVMQPASCRDELLSAVDVVGGSGERRVDHDVDGERSDIGRADDPADRERRPKLVAALLELVSEQRCRQGRVDESCGDEVYANRRQLKREGRGERGQCGGGGADDTAAVTDAPAAG